MFLMGVGSFFGWHWKVLEGICRFWLFFCSFLEGSGRLLENFGRFWWVLVGVGWCW